VTLARINNKDNGLSEVEPADSSGTDFAARLKLVLKDEPLLSFAKRSRVGEGSLRQYLKGAEPGLDKVIAIAKAAGVSVAWLATGEGSMEQVAGASAGLSDRLRICVRNAGTLTSLADSAGIKSIILSAYIEGRRIPSEQEMAAIARAAHVTAEWLKHGGEELPGPHLIHTASIPVMSVVAAAGDGAAVLREEVTEYMALSNVLVRSLRLTTSETFIMFARGESMEPLIRGGEPLICSKAERHLKSCDGIYVLRLEGDILVKHVQRLPGGKVRVFSENPSYAPFEVTLNDGVDFAILGKVLHSLRQV
jgi:phage repressor protein C with HTH and peptisase S24 domain